MPENDYVSVYTGVQVDEGVRQAYQATLDLAAEITRALAAEQLITQNLATEVQARIAAITAEAQTRDEADMQLQENIDTEQSTRQAADTTLQQNINSEAQTRAAADTSLQNRIAAASVYVTTTGTSAALIAQLPAGVTLADGRVLRLKLHVAPSDAATLTVANITGNILSNSGETLKEGPVAGSIITVVYNGSNFILQGEGGGSGAITTSFKRYGNALRQISFYELMVVGHFNPYYGR